jgi:hypothetical protein
MLNMTAMVDLGKFSDPVGYSSILCVSLLWTECLCPLNSYVEILTCMLMVLRGRTFRSQASHES